ncbi:MAG: RNA polymerase factor sigma-54 [Planctomycetes bacterium]|nr:RNA polymerase factor sigma-54 [Planctomycetota bacterium]
MKMEVHLQQKMEQRMQLSQQMLQNLELLQMPLMALKERLDQEMEENPTLEIIEPEDPEAAAQTKERETEEDRKREYMESFDEHWAEAERRYRGSSGEDDKKQEMLQNVGDKSESLRDHLLNQVALLEVDDAARPYIKHVIDNINDSGYLQFPIEEIVGSVPDELKKEDPELLKKKLENALHVVQKLEPRGVGARNPKECLLLQLDEHDPQYAAKRRLIERHLEDIANNRVPKIVKDFLNDPAALADLGHKSPADPDIVLEDVKMLIVDLQKLNPHPGANYASDVAPRVYPEVVIRQIDGKYEIVIEDSYLPPVTVNRGYQEMLKDKSLGKQERDYIRKKLDAGKKLISAIEQRRSTIQRITTEILKHQMDFFDHGIEHLRPLKMQEVADTVGIHVSTVSRAISEKWIETPRGVFPMKFFFASAAPKQEQPVGALVAGAPQEQDEGTRLAIMEKIRDIVADEERKNPLSDLQIAKILKQQGITAARRTIAKYREELGIPSSRLRKQY